MSLLDRAHLVADIYAGLLDVETTAVAEPDSAGGGWKISAHGTVVAYVDRLGEGHAILSLDALARVATAIKLKRAS